ncbi:MAG: NTPase, partial [Pseudonocardiales bacterium]|nr:NTPase [Pseudonocardiales bacterium]
MRGLRPGRPAVVVGGLGTAAVAAVVCTLVLGSRGAMIASVLGSLATVASLFVTITGVRARSVTNDRLLDTARQLARKVRSQEAEVLARLVADSGDPEPADVSFTQPALIYWRVDGGDRRGTLSEIKGYYRSLDRGRLVVLGEPGAGKTVLAIQLVLDLTAVVLDLADGGPPLPRVPVRLSLPAFDPGGDSDLAAAKVLSTKLDDWLVRHLVTAFGLTAAVAAALVTGGWILPILDGLDEMDRDDA